VPLEKNCPAGTFPAIPEGASDVVYVSAASSCTEDCGSSATPFPNITSALAAVAEGGHVLVGAGDYAEGVSITKPVHVVGLCAAKVVITGSVSVVSKYQSEVEVGGIAITDTSGVEVSGLTVASPVVGVAVVGATGVEVHDVEVTGSAGVGTYAGPGSELAAERLWLHDATVGSKPWLQFGVFAEGGAKLELKQSLVDSTRGTGVYARDGKTDVTVSDTTIRQTLCTAGGALGYGARVDEEATLRIVGSLLDGNRDTGIVAEGSGILKLENSAVLRTQPNDNGERGRGLVARESAAASISGCLFDGNTRMSVVVADGGTKLDLMATAVRNTKPKEGKGGRGLEVEEGASVSVSGCLVDGNTELSIAAFDPGTQVNLSATTVRNTKPHDDALGGSGMQASSGASVSVAGCLFEGNAGGGVSAWQSGTKLNLSETVVRGSAPNGVGMGGRGLEVREGASVSVSRCLFEHNTEVGILAGDSETDLELSATVVRSTLPSGAGEGGYGMDLSDGASASVSGCLFDGNTEVGVGIENSGTELELSATLVRDTKANDEGEGGPGMGVMDGAGALVTGCLFEGNAGIGFGVAGSGTKVDLSGTVVRDTMPDADGQSGHGLEVADASVSLTGCLIDGNTGLGIGVWHLDAELYQSETVVRETMPNSEGGGGQGIAVAEGASATIARCLFDGNAATGIAVSQSGAKMSLSTTVVRDTMPNGKGEGGYGMEASDGAASSVSACLFEANTQLGVFGTGPSTVTEVSATVVRDTMPTEGGIDGVGLTAQEGAETSVINSLLVHNATAGILAGADGSIRISESVVLNTEHGGAGTRGKVQVYGDGILAADGGTVDAESTIVAANGRNGVFFKKSQGSVIDSVIVGNEFYGLVMEQCADKVTWEGKGNYILGNAGALPSDEAAQVTTSTGGMPIPPAPKMVAVPAGPAE